MEKDEIIKKQLLFTLRGGNAHSPIKRGIKNFPIELINKKANNQKYSAWHLLEHMNICQNDILDFIIDPKYQSPEWPAGYWPPLDNDATEEMWLETMENFFAGLDEAEKFIKDDEIDLFKPLPQDEKYTLYREILVLASHNSYHLGQILLLQGVLT